MRDELAQGFLVSLILFSLYVNDTDAPSRLIALAVHADVAVVRATQLLVRYLQSSLNKLVEWS